MTTGVAPIATSTRTVLANPGRREGCRSTPVIAYRKRCGGWDVLKNRKVIGYVEPCGGIFVACLGGKRGEGLSKALAVHDALKIGTTARPEEGWSLALLYCTPTL